MQEMRIIKYTSAILLYKDTFPSSPAWARGASALHHCCISPTARGGLSLKSMWDTWGTMPWPCRKAYRAARVVLPPKTPTGPPDTLCNKSNCTGMSQVAAGLSRCGTDRRGCAPECAGGVNPILCQGYLSLGMAFRGQPVPDEILSPLTLESLRGLGCPPWTWGISSDQGSTKVGTNDQTVKEKNNSCGAAGLAHSLRQQNIPWSLFLQPFMLHCRLVTQHCIRGCPVSKCPENRAAIKVQHTPTFVSNCGNSSHIWILPPQSLLFLL